MNQTSRPDHIDLTGLSSTAFWDAGAQPGLAAFATLSLDAGAGPCSRASADELRRGFMLEARAALGPVLGFAQVLEADRFGDEVQELAGYIKAGALHLQLLVDDLVTLRQVESGRLPRLLMARPTALLPEASRAVMPVAELAGVALQDGDITDQVFPADPVMVVRALRILLWVAIHCTPRDRAVTVSAEEVEQGVAFHVASGSRFTSPLELDSDPWWNVNQVSPLGIRLVAAIARQHRGSLALHRPSRSCFGATLTFPAVT